MGQRFDASDPPMIYIYHFVSYDTTSIIFHGGSADESQNKTVKLPFLNTNNILSDQNKIISKPLNPKIVSSIVTSSVAKNRHIKIAGESIQNRIAKDDFLKIVKSYDFPKRTDFVFIGEINSLGDQYEIDFKLIDVTLQKVIGAKSFNLPFNSITELRPMIDSVVKPMIDKILDPFLGYAIIKVDSTSRSKIRWDKVHIRPFDNVVKNNIELTSEADFESFYTDRIGSHFLNTHEKILENIRPWSIEKEVKNKIIAEYNGYDLSISKIGEKTFGKITASQKAKIVDFHLLTDEEKENHINDYDRVIYHEVRKIWGSRVDDAYLIKGSNGDGKFLQGEYTARILLKNNQDPFQINFSINPGDLCEIPLTLPYVNPVKDSDGDGIIDEQDACPEIAGSSNLDPKKHGCPEPEQLANLDINNIRNGLKFELIKVEKDFNEFILTGSKENNKIVLDRNDQHTFIRSNQNSMQLVDIPFGLYVLNSYSYSSEGEFPGKHYLTLFSESDTLQINNLDQILTFNIPAPSKTLGRELVIYFDPFSINENDEYKLYLNDSSVPSASVSLAGELHVMGFPSTYNGNVIFKRDGFMPDTLEINEGTEKSFYLAKLDKPIHKNGFVSKAVPDIFEKIEQKVSNETKNFKIINLLKDNGVYKYLLISFLIF